MQYLISLWPMLQPILAGQLRHFLTLLAGMLVARGALEGDQSGAFVQIGAGLAGWAAMAAWSWWQKDGQARMLAALARLHGIAPAAASTGTAAKAAIDAATVARILIAALVLSTLFAGGSARAEGKKLNLPIDPLHLNTPGGGAAQPPSKPGACDITLFTNLTVANVITEIQNCVGSVVSAGATPFVADITAALKSATDAKDGTAMACLTPALAIATAAMASPDESSFWAMSPPNEWPITIGFDGRSAMTARYAAVMSSMPTPARAAAFFRVASTVCRSPGHPGAEGS